MPHTSRTRLAAVATLALLIAPASASATPASNGRNAIYSSIARTLRAGMDDTRMSETLRLKIEGHRTLANAAWAAGRHADARREFMAAARLMHSAGVLASTELYNVATLSLVEGRPRMAAETMDLLATDAATFGEPLVQAKALLEAATQYTAAGQPRLAHERVATLRLLLGSSHIPASFRAEATSRIAGA